MDKLIAIFGFLFLLLFAGCATQTTTSFQTQTPFSSEEEYLSFTSQFQSANSPYGSPVLMESTRSLSADSVTNTQVEGIDEGDILKSDGEFVFAASRNILTVTTAEGSLVEQLEFSNPISELFISSDNIFVFTSEFGWYSSTEFSVFVVDRDSFAVSELLSQEGSLLATRFVNDSIVVVSQQQFTSHLPVFSLRSQETSVPLNRIFLPNPSIDDASLAVIYTIDSSSLRVVSDAVVAPRIDEVYLNDHLVLSSTQFISQHSIEEDVFLDFASELVSSSDEEFFSRLDAVDSDILSSSEKERKKIERLYEIVSKLNDTDSFDERVSQEAKKRFSEYKYSQYTDIIILDFDSLGVSYRSNVSLPGRVYDQFGFDEYDGSLYVVTTTPASWSSSSYDDGVWSPSVELSPTSNHVFEVSLDGAVLSEVRNLAPSESVFSARFVDDLIYVVTFEQIDPLFVINRSDNLEVLGELKITGFSRYLHPVSDEVLLGFGRDASVTGRQMGLQITLFNVSNPLDPVVLSQWTSSSSSTHSSLEWDHRAFQLRNSTLIVPVSSWQDDVVSGNYVFSVSDSVELVGVIALDNPLRSAILDEVILSLSDSSLRFNSRSSLEAITEVSLQLSDDVAVY